ncbi:MAG: hypothetical protein NZM25_11795 [Leptospiraceae bacterium]|nr:hypothetical protein [Leptospiraceae bacterium]MDW8307379.1 hypothetical protein [Leptospiraceae bacterium]
MKQILAGIFLAHISLGAELKSFVADWENYRLRIDVQLDRSQLEDQHNLLHIRDRLKEECLLAISDVLEKMPVDNSYKLGDLLLRYPDFASTYAQFLRSLELQRFLQEGAIFSAGLDIPLRGPRGLLGILPLPYGRLRYEGLQEAEYVSEAYLLNRVQGEYLPRAARQAYSGLLIDVRSLPFSPSLAPRIFSQEGRLIYGPEYLSFQAVRQRALAGFFQSTEHPEVERRVGKKPFFVVPLDLRGKQRTDVVLAEEDVQELFAHPETLRNLQKTRVVFLVASERKISLP